MQTLNISEVRRSLPSVVDAVAKGRKSVVILRYGTPAAMLVPVPSADVKTNLYPLREAPIKIAGNFDEPLEQLWEATTSVAEPSTMGEVNTEISQGDSQ